MNRVLSVAGLATVAVLGASTLATAATPVHGTAQGTRSVTGVQVSATGWTTGVNDRGDVIGGYSVGGQPRAFFWHAGALTDLGTLPGGDEADAAAVNDGGYVVGYGNSGASPYGAQAFVWHDGTMTALAGPAGENSSADFVNDGGEIVGTLVPAMGQASAVIWQNGTMTTLPGGGTYTVPTGLNQGGEVVGYTYNASGAIEALAWIKGKAVQLGPGIPLAVNDAGAVLVNDDPADGAPQAYVWNNGRTTELPAGTNAAGFNDQGEVVGQYLASGASTSVGFSWENGTLTSLGAQQPIAINDRGEILAEIFTGMSPSSVVLERGETINLVPTTGQYAGVGYLSDSGLIAGESTSASNVTAWQLPNL